MKVVYTAAALQDLDDIADWLAVHYPAVAPAVERRIRAVIARIGRWPESARRSARRPGVRTVPVGRYPYRIFFRVTAEAVEILPSIMRRASRGTRRSDGMDV
jgi:plasmid stabilization system protein ParE